MPVFDIVGFLKAVKEIFIKVSSIGIIVAIKASTWVFVISSFALAATLIVKFYNWFTDFKVMFDTQSNATHIQFAKASGILSSLVDLFSFFLLVLTVFISYKISVYLKKFAIQVSREAQDIAMLIN